MPKTTLNRLRHSMRRLYARRRVEPTTRSSTMHYTFTCDGEMIRVDERGQIIG